MGQSAPRKITASAFRLWSSPRVRVLPEGSFSLTARGAGRAGAAAAAVAVDLPATAAPRTTAAVAAVRAARPSFAPVFIIRNSENDPQLFPPEGASFLLYSNNADPSTALQKNLA